MSPFQRQRQPRDSEEDSGSARRDELISLPADLPGGSPERPTLYEISIEVSEEALRRWGLTFDEIANAVRRFSVDLPGGSVKTSATGEILLRTRRTGLHGLGI